MTVLREVRNESIYTTLIEKTDLANRGRGLLVASMVSYSYLSGQRGNLEAIPLNAWEDAASSAISTAWLEDNLSRAVRSVLRWIEDDRLLVPDLTIDFSPLKQVLTSPQRAIAVLPLIQNTPTCQDDVDTIDLMTSQSLVSCLPAGMDITGIAEEVAENVSTTLPSEVSLEKLYSERVIAPESVQFLVNARDGVSALEAGIGLGLRLSVLLLAAYALLHATSIKDLTASLALPLFLVGCLILAIALATLAYLQWGLDLTLRTLVPVLDVRTIALIVDMIRTGSIFIIEQWIKISGVLIILALLIKIAVFGFGKIQLRVASMRSDDTTAPRRVRKQFR